MYLVFYIVAIFAPLITAVVALALDGGRVSMAIASLGVLVGFSLCVICAVDNQIIIQQIYNSTGSVIATQSVPAYPYVFVPVAMVIINVYVLISRPF